MENKGFDEEKEFIDQLSGNFSRKERKANGKILNTTFVP